MEGLRNDVQGTWKDRFSKIKNMSLLLDEYHLTYGVSNLRFKRHVNAKNFFDNPC